MYRVVMAIRDDAPRWTFLTNHGHVLVCLAQSPGLTLRDVAARVGVTERAVQRIVADLEGAGYLQRRRSGRQNEYDIDPEQPLRHPVEAHQRVQALIDMGATWPTSARAGKGTAKRAARASRSARRGA